MNKNWQVDLTVYENEISSFRFRILKINDFTIRHDLSKMLAELDLRLLEIVREQARCNLANKRSNHHKNLIIEFNELKESFIEYMTLGMLSVSQE